MSRNVAISSISTEWQALRASVSASVRQRFYTYGKSYMLDWLVRPIFDLAIAALIYVNGGQDLAGYVVIASAANMFLFSTIYFVGETLDQERLRGTLPFLFLSPSHRLSWLAGFAVSSIVETLGRILVVLVAGVVLFNVRFDVNPLVIAVALPLYLLSLAGLGLVLNGIGLVIKRANALSNLVTPFLYLLGGVYFPVDQMPEPLRQIARCLPLGYAMEIISKAALDNASLSRMQNELLILAGFAVISPIIGVLAFNWLEHYIRERGEVDLY